MDRPLLRAAFRSSIPVLMGYTTMGFAAGVLLSGVLKAEGLATAPAWGVLTSAVAVSGTLQFALVDWIRQRTPLLLVAVLTLCLNMRYAMYGFPLLDRFRGLPWWKKAYLVWALTDETFALEVANRVPPGSDSNTYCLLVALFDHVYWIVGVLAGTLAGSALPFDTRGIDFAMTALFLVILMDQCRDRPARLPALLGLAAALLARGFFPVRGMLIPAIVLLLAALACLYRVFAGAAGPAGRKEEAP